MLIDDERRAAILAPIDGGVGIDGREDEGAAGDLLRELRSQRKAIVRLEQAAMLTDDDLVLPEGSWDWERLAEEAGDYLATHGKDLEPMSVLVEAAARSDGLGDLAAAMALLADFVEAFWDEGLYPPADEDGVESRFLPLSGLSGGSNDKDGAMIAPLRRLAIARTADGDLRLLDKRGADAAMTASQTLAGEAKAARVEEAGELQRRIEAQGRRLSGEAFGRFVAQAGDAEAGWRRAIGYISERTKPDLPAASRLADELKAMREWLTAMAPPPETLIDEATAADGGAAGPGAGPGGVFSVGTINRREDALRAVVAAAQYFQTHEPLSPLGASLREVDRRARMTLENLLNELIPDDQARQDFYWRSGIKPPVQEVQEE